MLLRSSIRRFRKSDTFPRLKQLSVECCANHLACEQVFGQRCQQMHCEWSTHLQQHQGGIKRRATQRSDHPEAQQRNTVSFAARGRLSSGLRNTAVNAHRQRIPHHTPRATRVASAPPTAQQETQGGVDTYVAVRMCIPTSQISWRVNSGRLARFGTTTSRQDFL